MEFAALARHRPAIRRRDRRLRRAVPRPPARVADRIARASTAIDPDELPPVVVLVFMTSLSRMLVMEEGLGMSLGHAETRALIERWLTQVEGPPLDG